MASINLIVYDPKTEAGRAELAKRMSHVHAEAVIQQIRSLNCPSHRKQALLDEIIRITTQRSREQT